MVIGTPRYLAPEQMLGHAATPATDVYSMGVVMFEMLTGGFPFDADSLVATTEAQQSTALRLRSLRSDVPAALAAVVARALETQPGERPATAAALLAALDAASSPHARSTMGAEPTLLMTPAVGSVLDDSAATEVLLPASANTRHSEGSGRTAVMVFAGLLVLLGGVVAAVTLGSRDGVDDAVLTAAAAITSSVPASATAPTVIEPPVAEPTVITARVTEVVVPEPTVATLVPGFPATDDLEVFLLQVERDPDLLGQSGAELADELRKVIEQRGNEQRKTAQNLREVLVTWVADDEIPSAIADALDDLLAPLAKKG